MGVASTFETIIVDWVDYQVT